MKVKQNDNIARYCITYVVRECKALCQSVIIQFKIGIINNEIVKILNKEDLFIPVSSFKLLKMLTKKLLLILNDFHTFQILRIMRGVLMFTQIIS